MKNKKFVKVIAIATIVFLAYALGHAKGVDDVIFNQIISDENGTHGVYFSEYNGQINTYYYE